MILPPDPNPVYLMRMCSLVMPTTKESGLVLVSRAKAREERRQTRHIHTVVLTYMGQIVPNCSALAQKCCLLIISMTPVKEL